ncbi:unnamed protein product [Rotaria sordida]|uniref:Uncharacterized protein n=1 Tax=Rotaria sordida TaxID=392033 RepID=A0A814KWM4_9BILA|nr:unnamed protein product [Rotaria sordida]CAF3832942.1 unnamed protein product [Rotaria sordida]
MPYDLGENPFKIVSMMFISFAYFELGLGEDGIDIELSTSKRNSPDFQRPYQEKEFNASISDNILLDCSLRDIRHLE